MCLHISTIQTEEGYECLDCGRVLGHSWKRNVPVSEPVEKTYREWDPDTIDIDTPEVFSWDVYQPVF